jgi:hypothetical protein
MEDTMEQITVIYDFSWDDQGDLGAWRRNEKGELVCIEAHVKTFKGVFPMGDSEAFWELVQERHDDGSLLGCGEYVLASQVDLNPQWPQGFAGPVDVYVVVATEKGEYMRQAAQRRVERLCELERSGGLFAANQEQAELMRREGEEFTTAW